MGNFFQLFGLKQENLTIFNRTSLQKFTLARFLIVSYLFLKLNKIYLKWDISVKTTAQKNCLGC